MKEKKAKTRIGIDGHMIGDRSGGNERYYQNILREMQGSPDWEGYLFLKEGVDSAPFEDRFRIVRFKSSHAAFRNFIELPMLARKYHLDLLHTQYFIPFFCKCPIVCTIHDICFEHHKDIFTRGEYIRQKLLIPYAAKKSKLIFTDSVYSKQDIASKYRIAPERIAITYCATDGSFQRLDEQALDEEGLREQFGIGTQPYILTVGNLQPRKNLPRLIDAFQKMKAQITECRLDYKLVIVGKKAWMYSDVLKQASDPDIVLTDYVSETDLVRLYNAAEMFVYPSFFEGFGLPPLEAMACGTPVIVSNATSLPEVVGDAGLYFDPFCIDDIQNAIQMLLSDPDLKKKLVNNGFEQVRKFRWARSAQLICTKYREVIEKV